MGMKKLTPYQVVELEGTRKQAKEPTPRKRMTDLGCYIPAANAPQQQASRRITGSHLDPDSLEMEAAAVALAESLLDAAKGGKKGARILIGPANYSDRVLAKYCGMLIKTALGTDMPKTAHATNPPLSPAIVPYLLGGCTMAAVETAAWRALEVMEFFPEPSGIWSLNLSLSDVGFGPTYPHRQYSGEVVNYNNENEVVITPESKKYKHLSESQNWLLALPRTGSFSRILMDEGAYEISTRRYVNRKASKLIAEAERLLDPASGEMTEHAAKGRHAVQANQWTLQRAVHRVFERPWSELDLKGGGQENAEHDLEIVLARCLIHHVSYWCNMTAEAFVGISLLTGISMLNWARFAIEDLRRRGETFITDKELHRACDIAEVSPHYKCDDEVKEIILEMRFYPPQSKKWARRLQSRNCPLWSSNGFYYVESLNADGIPKYRHKPFSLASDD